MASEVVPDSENPLLKKKTPPPKKDPLWDFDSVPSSIHPSEGLTERKEPTKWWQFWKKDGVHPVVRIDDLNNPVGDDDGRKEKPAIVIGVRGTF